MAHTSGHALHFRVRHTHMYELDPVQSKTSAVKFSRPTRSSQQQRTCATNLQITFKQVIYRYKWVPTYIRLKTTTTTFQCGRGRGSGERLFLGLK